MSKTINIQGNLNIRIEEKINPYGFQLEDLFYMAARINKKRKFLFVSKVLGKHYPVTPEVSLEIGRRLASELVNGDEKFHLEEETLFIGFAETATALGHSVFDAFKENAYYIHTTRDEIKAYSDPIQFKEEHSHATDHNVYPVDFDAFEKCSHIVLIDDEITTGKTCRNIIREIHERFPKAKYTVLTILDWRGQSDLEAVEVLGEELGAEIKVLSILSGAIEVNGTVDVLESLEDMKKEKPCDTVINEIEIENFIPKRLDFDGEAEGRGSYIAYTGRFGITSSENAELQEMLRHSGEHLKKLRKGKRTLCMGTGEFMYIPMAIGNHMGEGVKYQSCTRSPIYPVDREGYGARTKFEFKSYYDQELSKYFYNIHEGQYDELFVFLERRYSEAELESFYSALRSTGIEHINVVFC